MNNSQPNVTIGTDRIKRFRSVDYNYNFNLTTGMTVTWGRNLDDNPEFCPYGNTIADVEISYGAGCIMNCPFCYKGNTKGNTPKNMSLETFKQIFSKFPRYGDHLLLQQIAIGLTSVKNCPDFFPIAEYCRENNVIPNVTINGMEDLNDEQLDNLVRLMGAMAVSINNTNFEQGLNLIKKLTDRGAKQINIHYVVSKESIDFAYTVCDAVLNDDRLKEMNAIVFLSLKPKSRGENLNILPEDEFKKLIRYCLDNEIRIGGDSCSCHKISRSFNKEESELYNSCIEPCESTCSSLYLSADGVYFPCSFLEGENRDIWQTGINILEINDFLKDLWFHPSVVKFRNDVLESNKKGQNCCHFSV